MSFSFNVERALAGKCVECGRKLGKKKGIVLYHARGNHWEKGWARERSVDVDVCVCGPYCQRAHNEGRDVA